MLLGRKGTGTDHAERPRRHPIPELRPFDEIVVGEPMEGPRQLFRMDPQPAPETLECHARCRILREEFQDLPVVLPEVAQVGFNARFATLWHH